jgi:hypothetical protein
MTLVRNHVASHLASIVARPLNFDGRTLTQCILDGVLKLNSLLVEHDLLGIPAEGRGFDQGE